jgi:hypothetical protein
VSQRKERRGMTKNEQRKTERMGGRTVRESKRKNNKGKKYVTINGVL